MRSPVKLAVLPVIGALLAACGAAPPPPPSLRPDPAPQGIVKASPPWQTYADPIAGFSVALPGEPHRDRHFLPPPVTGEMREMRFSDGDPRTPDFEVTRLAPTLMPGPADPERVAEVLLRKAKGAHKEKRTRHGHEAIELQAESPMGPFACSILAVGGWIYVLSVNAKDAIDLDAAERFFDSLRIEVPWRIETFPEEGLTLSVPAPAVIPPVKQPALPGGKIRVYEIDWEGKLWISVTLFGIDENRVRTMTPDEMMADGIRALAASPGTRIAGTVQIEHHGMIGREIAHTMADGQAFRSRMFVVGRRGYHVSISSKDPLLLTGDTANRVLDSIRIEASQAQ